MAATLSLCNGSRSVSPITIVSEYIGEDGLNEEQLSRIWNQNVERFSASEFVDWLLNEKIINFPKSVLEKNGIPLFTKHIYPLLLDIASVDAERAFIHKLANRVQEAGHFIAIIPKFTSAARSQSRMYQLRFEERMGHIIEIVLDSKNIHRMQDSSKTWYLKSTSFHTQLLHELIHVNHSLSPGFKYKVGKDRSYRFDDREEEETIKKENAFARGRREMERVSHKSLDSEEAFLKRTNMQLLHDAMALGAEGTVKWLLQNSAQALVIDSPERLQFTENTLKECALAYCKVYPPKEAMQTPTDISFYEDILAHKNKALEFLTDHLLAEQQTVKAEFLLQSLTKLAPEKGREDALNAISKIADSVKKYSVATVDEDVQI